MVGPFIKLNKGGGQTTPSAPWFLIVGLGNPGERYAHTRHNVGFQCVDRLSRLYDIPLAKKRFHAVYGEGHIGDRRVILAKPHTFMNESGKAVAPLINWFKIPPTNVIVIYDDLDLPLAKVRLRPEGSSGGHRGIESIIANWGRRDFARVRVGIGRPALGDPVDYVLGIFGPDQAEAMDAAYQTVEKAVACFLESGIIKAMNDFNG